MGSGNGFLFCYTSLNSGHWNRVTNLQRVIQIYPIERIILEAAFLTSCKVFIYLLRQCLVDGDMHSADIG